MKRLLKSYFSLTFVETRFTDVVSGQTVKLYVDCFGDFWLKDGRWSLFRVEKKVANTGNGG